MKPYNEQEFNKLCAEFFEWKQNSKKSTFYVDKNDGRHIYEIQDLKFHSDWNWIMEVVEKIESLKGIKQFHIVENSCYMNGGLIVGSFQNPLGKKEAVVQAIWQFINWYNEQKR